ncbi:MAG: AAA-like domain-containing protein [Cyanobacteria bacterium P01_A01_bin.84]
MTKTNIYSLGGTVQASKGIYISRKADETLLELCKQGEFSYVLTSRQMGKSSLMINTASGLKKADIKSVIIDLTKIGTQVTVEQWYLGLLLEIEEQLMLDTDIAKWWQKNDNLGFTQRLSKFFQNILLEEVKTSVVIFIDEIDTTLSLDFTDDFFAVIRYLYVARAENSKFERISFVLIGVATPGNLIHDLKRTSFNIGKLVDLTNFTFEEAKPLAEGLGLPKEEAEKLLNYALKWTNGQPFLTQKLCKLIVASNDGIPEDNQELWLENLVAKCIIESWKKQDEPQHLRTIRDRILNQERRAGRLLSTYQKILEIGGIEVDSSSEQIELRLSGLVIEYKGKLRVYNRIYELVFNLDWVEKQLSILRPYAQAFKSWVASNCQEESYLLRGQALEDAKAWAADKDLSDLDFKFLTACQELEKSQVQVELDAQRQANESLSQGQRQKRRQIRIGMIVFISSLIVSALAVREAFKFRQQAEGALKDARYSKLKAANSESKALFALNDSLGALIASVKAGKILREIEKSEEEVPSEIKNETLSRLQPALYSAQEINRIEGHKSIVWEVSLSSDGLKIASASDDKTLKLWNRAGKLLQSFKGHDSRVYSVSFSPDSKKLASAGDDNTLKLWKLDGTLLKTFKGHNRKVLSVKFSPDGTKLISASNDKTVKLWNLDGTLLNTFNDHTATVYDVDFSPDGKTIASSSFDRKIKIWDINGKLLKTLNHQDWVFAVSFSPDSKKLASAGRNKKVKIWKLDSNNLPLDLPHSGEVLDVNFSSDGKKIVSSSDDKTIKIWKSDDGTLIKTLKGHDNAIRSVKFNNPDNRTVVSSSDDGTIRLWNGESNFINTLPHSYWVRKVIFSPNGQMIATASDDSQVKIWSNKGKFLKSLRGVLVRNGLSFSPDSQMIATGDTSNTIKIWNLDTTLHKTLKSHNGWVYDVNFSPNGNILASASGDKTVKIWNIKGKLLKTLKGHKDAVNRVSFSPDGKKLASASDDQTVKIWKLDGTLLKTLSGHDAQIFDVNFSPDGKTIASAGADETIKLWKYDGTLQTTFKGHKESVRSVTFSPDGKRLVSASEDYTVKLWSYDGTLLETLENHSNKVRSVNFSPDGKILASASDDKTVILQSIDKQDLNFENLLNSACEWLDDYLNNMSNEDKKLCDDIPVNKEVNK